MARRNPTAVWLTRYEGKRGTSYRLRWIDPRTGKWMAEPCGRDMAYARERRDQIRQELRDGLAGRLPERTIEQFVAELHILMAGKSPDTIEKTKDSLRKLSEACKVNSIRAIDRAAVMAFRAKRLKAGVSPATVNKHLREIRSALSYAADAGYLKYNPLLRWKGMMLREPEKQVRVVEEGEFTKLLDACENPTFRALLIVAYRGGLRRCELVNLRWSAVDLDKRVVRVVNVAEAGEFTKSRKNRAVPMHPDVQAMLGEMYEQAPKVVQDGRVLPRDVYVFSWPGGRPYTRDWVSHEFARLVKKAKVAHCSPHDLRRSFSTIAQRAGVDKYTVKDLGGWSQVSVVEKHYTGNVDEVLRKAMDRIANTA